MAPPVCVWWGVGWGFAVVSFPLNCTVHLTLGLYAFSMDISTFCPLTGFGCLWTGGDDDFWLLRQTQMKKKRKAMASGMATLGTRMYKISILFFSLESLESGCRKKIKGQELNLLKQKCLILHGTV